MADCKEEWLLKFWHHCVMCSLLQMWELSRHLRCSEINTVRIRIVMNRSLISSGVHHIWGHTIRG